MVFNRDELAYNLMTEITKRCIGEAIFTYGAQKILVADYLGISILELDFLSEYLGIDSKVWKN